MRVSDSHRLLFVHVQKTGGRTIEQLMDDSLSDSRGYRGARHASLEAILGREPALANYWIFGFVRNPWARIVSWWSMTQRELCGVGKGSPRAVKRVKKLPVWAAASRSQDFTTFVRLGLAEVAEMRRPQIDYLRTPSRAADFIGRTESFAADVNTVLSRLRLPPRTEVPHVGPGTYGSYRDFYTPVTRDLVAATYEADIEAFGYEF